MIKSDDWLRAYLAETGREIDTASSQLHETTNWALGVVMAAVSAVAISGSPYPSRWSLAVVVIAWVLTIRFFVRSCIAYSYLARRNKIQRKIIELQLCTDSSTRNELQDELKQAIELYDVQWKSATPVSRLLLSNIKLGYGYLFMLTFALLLYGFANSDWTDWMTSTLLVIAILVVAIEAYMFPIRTYLEFKPIEVRSSNDANPEGKGSQMKVPESEQYVELKTHLRYLNEKMIEAFSRFIAIATAIIAGTFYVHTELEANDPRRHGLAIPASATLTAVGICTIVLIVTNLVAWHKFRRTLSDNYPDIPRTRSMTSWIGEIIMCVLVVIASIGVWFVNPLK